VNKIIAGIKLIRPLNGLVAALSLVAAEAVACGRLELPHVEAAAVFFLVSFGYVINDICDQGADRMNRPHRALPSGAVTVKEAWMIAQGMLVVGLGVALAGGTKLFSYYVAVALVLMLYAKVLSSRLLVSNVVVAALCASVFLLPAWQKDAGVVDWAAVLAAITLTFLFNLMREIVKDIEDVAGDRVLGRTTVPITFGAGRARLTASVIGLLVVLASVGAYGTLNRSATYLSIVILGVDLPLAILFVLYLRRDPVGFAGRVSVVLKVLMMPALVALAAAGVK